MPDVVGVGSHSSIQYLNCIETCRSIKAVNSKIITVIGGTHPTAYSKDTLEDFPEVDYILKGESEYSFLDLLVTLNSDKPNLTKIDGLAYRQNGDIIVCPKKVLIENLDELPFPARHLVPIEQYFRINMNQNLSFTKRSLPILTSRGCPYRCTFCSTTIYWQHSYRTRSPEKRFGRNGSPC